MTEYVPDDAEICAQWLSYVTEVSPSGDWDTLPEEDAVMRWNAWLEARDRTERAAALREAATLARSMADDEADGYYGQACYEVAKAIESRADRIERGQ